MSDVKAERKPVVSKNMFLAALSDYMKKKGVQIVSADGKVHKSQADFWDLYTGLKKFEVAAAAAAGTTISLSGVGTFQFRMAGGEENRRMVYKAAPSSTIRKHFDEAQDEIFTEKADDAEELISRIEKVFSSLSPESAVSGPPPVGAVLQEADEQI